MKNISAAWQRLDIAEEQLWNIVLAALFDQGRLTNRQRHRLRQFLRRKASNGSA